MRLFELFLLGMQSGYGVSVKIIDINDNEVMYHCVSEFQWVYKWVIEKNLAKAEVVYFGFNRLPHGEVVFDITARIDR